MSTSRVLAVLCVGTLLCVLVALGCWQWERGRAKAQLLATASVQGAQPTLELDACPAARALYRQARARGVYQGRRQVLVDNRIQNGQPGYEVVTPLRLDSGQILAINRGWVPLGESRGVLPHVPVPEGRQTVTGELRAPSHNRFLGAGFTETVDGVRRVAELHPADLVDGAPACAQVLLLNPDPAEDFVRRWPLTVMTPQRHYAYAAQWFAMALAVLVLGAWLWRYR